MPLSRKKSCWACREAKARCDLGHPVCSRCTKRDLRCTYEDLRVSNRASPYAQACRGQPQHFDREPLWEVDEAFCQFDHVRSVTEMDALGLEPEEPEPVWVHMENIRSEDLMISKGFGTPNLFNVFPEQGQTSGSSVQEVISDQPHNREPEPPITRPSNHRILTKRSVVGGCAHTTIMVGQMTSFPKMMIEGDRLPPFVHAPCHLNEEMAYDCGEKGSHQCLPEDLAICASLVRMFYSRNKANESFVWKSVYTEVKRLRQEVWLLAAEAKQNNSAANKYVVQKLQSSKTTSSSPVLNDSPALASAGPRHHGDK